MDTPSSQALEREEALTQLVCNAVRALATIVSKGQLGSTTAFASMVGASLNLAIDLDDWEELRALETTEEFQMLREHLMQTTNTWKIILGFDRASIKRIDQPATILRTYLTAVLKRAISNIHFVADAKSGVEKAARDFVAFLSDEPVQRRVTVPLFHVRIESERYDFGEFGTIRRVAAVHDGNRLEEFADAMQSTSALDLTVETGKFLHALLFDLYTCLHKRVASIRLATHPFVSYNHFGISHSIPWEFPLQDSNFHARFRGTRVKDRQSRPSFVMDEGCAEKLNTVYRRLNDVEWNRITPWRLAMDRLDDAVFKIDCGLPDAILDVMIGMEGLFVEPDSRQESAHKVATRAARFLADDRSSRNEIFKTIKRSYGIRSTLAHGQHWGTAEGGGTEVGPGAVLLCRTLRKMLEGGISQIPHQDIDLS